MSILQITDLAHAFGDRELYRNANLSLFKGEHMGVVGQNGSGKSTLLRILLGELSPTEGHVAWQRNITVGHLDQYAAIDGAMTMDDYLHTAFDRLYAAEQRMLALYAQAGDKQLRQAQTIAEQLQAEDFYALDSRIARVAAGLGLTAIGLERPLNTLSGGQRTKVILAKLLLRNPDVLLLDEPTNFLDAEHIQWLTGYLNAFAGSFMIVSHDFDFLDAITNCVCDIEFRTIQKYHGRYREYVRQKAHQRESYERRYQAQQREVAKLEDYIARNKVRASTAKMAKSRQKQLDRMDILSATTVQAKPQIAFAQLPLAASHALEIQSLRVGYDRPLLPGLTLTVAGGQKVVIRGFNGIGKTTLLKTLVGQLPAIDGQYAFAPEVRIGYFRQDTHWPDTGLSPLQIVGAAYPNLLAKQIRRELARYGVKAEHVMRPIGTLSGGEQNKVKLCLLSMTPTNFLILDEPTNHLDAETKEALHEAIAAFGGSVILVCHEQAFYRGIADRVIDMENVMAG